MPQNAKTLLPASSSMFNIFCHLQALAAVGECLVRASTRLGFIARSCSSIFPNRLFQQGRSGSVLPHGHASRIASGSRSNPAGSKLAKAKRACRINGDNIEIPPQPPMAETVVHHQNLRAKFSDCRDRTGNSVGIDNHSCGRAAFGYYGRLIAEVLRFSFYSRGSVPPTLIFFSASLLHSHIVSGVLPVPPVVIFPMLITGTGAR